MSHDSPPPGAEAPKPRPWWNLRGALDGLFARLDGSRPFRPVALVVTALLCGVLLAPQLASQNFPTDPGLIGRPADGNFKAPRDLEVVDEEMTDHLRQAAAAEARRVYDFDTQAGAKIGKAVEAAFDGMQPLVQDFVAQHPEGEGAKVGRAQTARLREAFAQALAAAQPEFEKRLGTALRPEEVEELLTLRYDPEVGQRLGLVLRDLMAQPVIASEAALDADRQRGIAVRRLPDDHKALRDIRDIESVASLERVRQALAADVQRLFAESPLAAREFIITVGSRLLHENLTFSPSGTELLRKVASASVEAVTFTVKKGEMVVRDGDKLERRHLLIFQALQDASRGISIVLAVLGAAAAVFILIFVALTSAKNRGRGVNLRARDLLFLTNLFVLELSAARLWLVVVAALHERFSSMPMDAFLALMPIAAGAMITRLVLGPEVGVGFGVLVALVLGLMGGDELPLALYLSIGSALGATVIGPMSARGELLRAGLWVGLGQAAAVAAIELFAGETDVTVYFAVAGAGFAGGIMAGLLTLSLTPVVEALFGYSTDLKLLELANLNHPALKQLIVQAPGSYHHSVIVGSLVEAAAEAIGANPLLARVMAYYHDIGKSYNPQYFIENQRAGQNPHDKLKPSMSAMIIRRHVTDGLEIARHYGLGEAIQAAIAEHHGTTLIHFFHHKAKEQSEEEIAENDYRYPGSKPQSREAALVMLGDAVEAAARSQTDPAPARLQGVISRIINLKFTDGQLEECDLTLKDLHVIARSFGRVLGSIYHHRPEYPEQQKDAAGKKQNVDPDGKAPKKPQDPELPSEEDLRPENLRRLGLS